MNYEKVIPFDSRQQVARRDSGRGCAVVLSTKATPMIRPSERQSTATLRKETSAGGDEVLFEQLAYLIEFADQERERLERVKTILLETFN